MNISRSAIRSAGLGVAIVVAAVAFVAMRAAHTTATSAYFWSLSGPEAILDGIAATPFQYRILIPAVVRLIRSSGLPISAMDAFRALDLIAVIAVLSLGCVTLRQFRLPLALVPILFIELQANYAGPFDNFFTCYDMPAIALFMLGMLALHRGNDPVFYAALAIGMLNRETASLLAVLFAVTRFDKLPRTGFLAHLAAQLLLIIAIKGSLAYVYRHNPGVGLFSAYVSANDHSFQNSDISRLEANWAWLLTFGWLPLFGFMWLPLAGLGSFIRDAFVRRSLLLIPAEAFAMMIAGNLWEARIFNEIVPVIFLGAAAGLAGAVRSLDPAHAP